MRIETARSIRKQAETPKTGLQVNTVVSMEAKPAIKRITDIFVAASVLSIIFVVILCRFAVFRKG
jgi:lipopolysaccharide/colanic/teichoic acid biosynthesis glycosyltransferase